jgi:hypothetical protein
MLGHANLKSLKQYLKVTVDDMRKFHGSSRLGQ